MKRWLAPLVLSLAVSVAASDALADLVSDFTTPPPAARPWVYWFWNNGNVTRAGITADLEAMQRVGVGGVILMDVVERFAPPPGAADYMSAEWQSLIQFSVEEASRLGLEINMTNGPGWCGSSGPWVTPEMSMQTLVSSTATVEGGATDIVAPARAPNQKKEKDGFDSVVKFAEFYRDVAILAYPADKSPVAPGDVIDLTDKLGPDGKLAWTPPPGKWTIARIGAVSTGSSTRPPVKGGNGLEIDKLSAEAMDLQFDKQMGVLIQAAGKMAGPMLSATHIDSWEVGSQNWTPKMRAEFKQRRGYDPLPYLPNVLAFDKPAIGDRALANRFRWDYEQTCAELLADNYVGRLATRAHEKGLRLSIEGYDLPFGDQFVYASRADEPMSEFWVKSNWDNPKRAPFAASIAHTMGHAIVGAEAFTSNENEEWRQHPASVKAIGDLQLSQGVNRFVVHRYAHQPYLDKVPGATMGPWGLHYERTNTWWEMSGGWHTYLARCQQMLREGKFVADLLYLRPEKPNQMYFTPNPAPPTGYRYDEISAEALLARASVKDGRIVLPDGMSYRLLVLPPTETMTPALATRIRDLVNAGAAIYGAKPTASPSLQDYPACDQQVAAIASDLWAGCDGNSIKARAYGKGQIQVGTPLDEYLRALSVQSDFTSSVKLNWIHRDTGDAQIYFVASTGPAVETTCTFRAGGQAEWWNPETGERTPIALRTTKGTMKDGTTTMPLRLEAGESAFIVFRDGAKATPTVASVTRDGQPLVTPIIIPKVAIVSASYGPPNDPARTRDVKAKLQTMVDDRDAGFLVGDLAKGDDPAYGTLKTLTVEYQIDGKPGHYQGVDTDTIAIRPQRSAPPRQADVTLDTSGELSIRAREPGMYVVTTGEGGTKRADVKSITAPVAIEGPWQVEFTKGWGAPDSIRLDKLVSLSEHPDDGVKHYSGTIRYTTSFDFTPSDDAKVEWSLELGEVQVMAQVALNGVELGTCWNPPMRLSSPAFRKALKPGRNTLEARVANLWPNRMIADAALPKEKRLTWSSWEPFKPDSPLPRSGLIGPVRLVPAIRVPLK